MRRPGLFLATIALVLALGGASLAGDDVFLLVVNPGTHITELDADQLRNIYLKRVTELDGDVAAQPVDLPPGAPARERFTHDVIRKTPAQLRSYWNQQIFTGKGVPPVEAESPASAIEFVLTHPGAVAYVPAGIDLRGAKVIRLK